MNRTVYFGFVWITLESLLSGVTLPVRLPADIIWKTKV